MLPQDDSAGYCYRIFPMSPPAYLVCCGYFAPTAAGWAVFGAETGGQAAKTPEPVFATAKTVGARPPWRRRRRSPFFHTYEYMGS